MCRPALAMWFHIVGKRTFHGVESATNRRGLGHNDTASAMCDRLNNVVAISAGYYHCMASKANGTEVAWGWNDDGQCTIRPAWRCVAITAGGMHSMALKSDGPSRPGANDDGQCECRFRPNDVVPSAEPITPCVKTDEPLWPGEITFRPVHCAVRP
jgi:alpha-tubulin suppressor-like RCC1 family protein